MRTDDISVLKDDGKDASIEQIEFLLNNREKSLLRKEQLIERASKRCFLPGEQIVLSVYCVPTYPDHPLVDLNGLAAVADANKDWKIFSQVQDWQTVHEGLLARFGRQLLAEPLTLAASEFNVYGLVYYNTSIGDFESRDCKPGFIGETCSFIMWCVAMSAETFYRNVRYSGLVDVVMQLTVPNMAVELRFGRKAFDSANPNFKVTHRTFAHKLNEHSSMSALFRDFLWASWIWTKLTYCTAG